MNIQIQLTGTSPLLVHNIELSDPDNDWAKQIAKISSKRKKTEEDRREIEKLEWYGGLYTDWNNGGIVMPARCIKRAIVSGARARKLGKHVERALQFTDLNVPIVHDGPKDIDKLFSDKRYHNRASVRIQNNRIMRVRPQFPNWAVVANAILLEDVMDLAELETVIKFTGVAEGLCDNRVNGYGRFEAKVNVLAAV
jgi:hypothetical protein